MEERAQFVPAAATQSGETVRSISPAEVRRRLEYDLELPTWFLLPEVTAEMRLAFPPRSRQGFTLFMTGLSGAGKSTLAKLLYVKFMSGAGSATGLTIISKAMPSRDNNSRRRGEDEANTMGRVA